MTPEGSSSLQIKHGNSVELMAWPCLYSFYPFPSHFFALNLPQLHSALYTTTICRPLDNGTSSFMGAVEYFITSSESDCTFSQQVEKCARTALEVREREQRTGIDKRISKKEMQRKMKRGNTEKCSK